MPGSEWDNIAKARYIQQTSQVDITFAKLFVPLLSDIILHLPNEARKNVLELGSGTGVLSAKISKFVEQLTCIDPSAEMNKIARWHTQDCGNIQVLRQMIEDYQPDLLYSSCLAHMVLHNIRDIDVVLKKVYDLLGKGGYFIFTIPHPCFYHQYKANDFRNFRYDESKRYELPFTISLDQKPLPEKISYYHRTLSDYVNALVMNGFSISHMEEPYPEDDVMSLYPKPWENPRYLLITALKK